MLDLDIDLSGAEPGEGKADAIRRAVERAIMAQQLRPGEALPTIRALAESLGINKNTVAVAYRQLQQGGLVLADGRRGSVVSMQGSRPRTGPGGEPGQPVPSLRDGNPDPAMLPNAEEIREAFLSIDATPRLYGEARNHAPLVEWARERFEADGVAVPHGIFVSAGALDLIERALTVSGLRTGDKVGVEDPGYRSAHALVRAMGLLPVPLAVDQHGVVPAALRRAQREGIRAAIVTSRAHNPTGVTTSAARAAELRKLVAQGGDVLYLDDDHSSLLGLAPYHGWHTGAHRWLTVRSLSKALGPDYRLAVSSGDADTLQRLEYRQGIGMGWVSALLQRLAFELLGTARMQKRFAAAGAAYRERHAALATALRQRDFEVLPGVGLNLWVPVPDEREVARRLFDAGWMVRSGGDYCIGARPGIRVTSARMTPGQIVAFADALAGARSDGQATLTA